MRFNIHKKNIFGNAQLNLFSNHKTFCIIITILSAICFFAGIISAIRFNNGLLPINFSNVIYINYLKAEISWLGFLFLELLTATFFIAIFVTCFCNKWISSISILFFLYFVYAKLLTLVSMLLVYGFINTLIIFLVLFACSCAYLISYLALMLSCIEIRCNGLPYFRNCFVGSTPSLLACIYSVAILEAILMGIMKSFVVVLIY